MDLRKQKEVQNALAQYGQPGFSEEMIMKADPELGIKLANLRKQGQSEQLKAYSSAAEIGQKLGPTFADNLPGYLNFYKQMMGMGLGHLYKNPLEFIDQSTGQPNIPALNNYAKQLSLGNLEWKAQAEQNIKGAPTRELKVGDKIITQEFVNGQWRVIGEAGRWDDRTQLNITRTNQTTGEIENITVGGKGTGQAAQLNPPPVQSDIYKKITGLEDSMANVNQITANYKPGMQTIGGKMWGSILQMWDSLAPGQITEDQDKYLREYATHRASSASLLNRLLNQLSGAAVSEHEAKRLQQEIPVPGVNWWNGDNPRDFEAKLKRFQETTELAIARYTKWAKEGVVPQNVAQLNQKSKEFSLEDMKRLMVNRIGAVKADLKRKNPNLSDTDLSTQAGAIVRQEYNLR